MLNDFSGLLERRKIRLGITKMSLVVLRYSILFSLLMKRDIDFLPQLLEVKRRSDFEIANGGGCLTVTITSDTEAKRSVYAKQLAGD